MKNNGTAGLYFLDPGTTTNGAKYKELLNDKLKLCCVSVRASFCSQCR